MNKFKLSYLFLLFITFSFAFLVGGPMPYFLFYVSILSFLIPFFHLLLSFIGLKAELDTKQTEIYAGDNIDLEYLLINKNFFTLPIVEVFIYINKTLKEKNIISKKLSLNARQKILLKDRLSFKRRGFYKNINFSINISDIYSIFKLKKKINNKINLLVYPKIIKLDSFKVYPDKTFGNVLVENSIFKDKTSISSIDEYIEGDPINQIHWKVSAKRGTPMIKNFEQISNVNLNLFIESYKPLFSNDIDHRMEDKIVDVSLAIVSYLFNLDIDISLNTYSGNDPIKISNVKKDRFKYFLETFSRFQSDGQRSILDLIEEKINSFTQNSIVIIVAPILDKKMAEIGIKLKMKNVIPIFISIYDKNNDNYKIDSSIKKRLNEENIQLYFLDYHTNVKETLEINYE